MQRIRATGVRSQLRCQGLNSKSWLLLCQMGPLGAISSYARNWDTFYDIKHEGQNLYWRKENLVWLKLASQRCESAPGLIITPQSGILGTGHLLDMTCFCFSGRTLSSVCLPIKRASMRSPLVSRGIHWFLASGNLDLACQPIIRNSLGKPNALYLEKQGSQRSEEFLGSWTWMCTLSWEKKELTQVLASSLFMPPAKVPEVIFGCSCQW